jgi:hypothetical protein
MIVKPLHIPMDVLVIKSMCETRESTIEEYRIVDVVRKRRGEMLN